MFVSLLKHIVVFISSEYKGVYKNKHYNTFMACLTLWTLWAVYPTRNKHYVFITEISSHVFNVNSFFYRQIP